MAPTSSGVERSLLDGAARMDLIGGANVLAEALNAAQPDPAVLQRLAGEIGAAPALRRIGSLVDQLPIPELVHRLEPLAARARLHPEARLSTRASFRRDSRSGCRNTRPAGRTSSQTTWPVTPRSLRSCSAPFAELRQRRINGALILREPEPWRGHPRVASLPQLRPSYEPCLPARIQ